MGKLTFTFGPGEIGDRFAPEAADNMRGNRLDLDVDGVKAKVLVTAAEVTFEGRMKLTVEVPDEHPAWTKLKGRDGYSVGFNA